MENEFYCSACKKNKSPDVFYIRKNGKPSGWCKSCFAEYYKKNQSAIREVNKNYRKTKDCLLARLKRHLNNWECLTYYNQRRRAVKTVRIALACGEVTRPVKCDLCEKQNAFIDAHHNDYTKPLEIEWVCRKCHKMVHRQINNAMVLQLGA